MEKHFYLLSTFLLSFLPFVAMAQQNDSIRWASPRVKNMPVGRGFDIGFTQIYSNKLAAETKVDRIADDETDMQSLTHMEYDLKFPVLIMDRSQFIASLEYSYDYFRLKDPEALNYEFFDIMDRKHLRSRKLKLYLVHSFNEKNFMDMRGSIELNGDVSESSDPIYTFAKYSLSFVYGWQKSATNSYGIGLYMDYALGRPSIYPVFEWNKTWNDRWGFESKLPAKFMLRYTPNPGLRIYGGYDVTGISYRVFAEKEETNLLKAFEVRRSDVRLSLDVEKRIYDFVWCAFEGGLDYNIRLNAADNNNIYDNTAIIAGHMKTAPFVHVSLFIMPTEGLKKIFGYEKNVP